MLGNFPLSPRLRTLLLARNRIASIQPPLAKSLPNLTTLVLASNNIAELADLDVLGTFPVLTHLVLMDNPVTRKEVRDQSSLVDLAAGATVGEMRTGTDILSAALPTLDLVALSKCPVFGLQEGQVGREGESRRTFRLC
jgi:hypothetical protein